MTNSNNRTAGSQEASLRHYVFISNFDEFEIDLLELNNSNYIQQTLTQPFYIFLAYAPGPHRIFLNPQETKNQEETFESFKLFQDYIDNNFDDQFLSVIVSDEGKEFTKIKKDFENIEFQTINSQSNDNLQLAPINSMCNHVRKQIMKQIQTNYEQTQKINLKQLQIICNEFNSDFNYKHNIKLYNKPPKEITRNDVEEMNIKKEFINKKVEEKNKFEIGDIVQVILKKNKLDKARIQKYSSGTYQIIDKQGVHFLISPFPFDFEAFKKAFDISDKICMSIPVYYYKAYEMKSAKPSAEYFPREMIFSWQMQMTKIVSALIKKEKWFYEEKNEFEFLDSDFEKYYEISLPTTTQTYYIRLKQLRIENVKRMSDSETYFWDDYKKNPKQIFSFSLERDLYKVQNEK